MEEYKAVVTFSEAEGAAVIRWDVNLKPRFPLTGGLCCGVAKGAVNKLIDAVEKALTGG